MVLADLMPWRPCSRPGHPDRSWPRAPMSASRAAPSTRVREIRRCLAPRRRTRPRPGAPARRSPGFPVPASEGRTGEHEGQRAAAPGRRRRPAPRRKSSYQCRPMVSRELLRRQGPRRAGSWSRPRTSAGDPAMWSARWRTVCWTRRAGSPVSSGSSAPATVAPEERRRKTWSLGGEVGVRRRRRDPARPRRGGPSRSSYADSSSSALAASRKLLDGLGLARVEASSRQGRGKTGRSAGRKAGHRAPPYDRAWRSSPRRSG